MTRKILLPLLLTLPSLFCYGQETDVELWLSAQIQKDFNKKFRIYYEQGYRRDHNLTELKFLYFEAGGYYKPVKYLWFGPYYRYYDDFSGQKAHHLTGVLLLRYDPARFELRSKSRFIVEFGDGEKTDYYLRERISAGYNIPDFKLDPYVAPEIIVHFQPDKTEIEQIRLEMGINYQIAKHHDIEFFYRYKIDRNVKNPVNSHIIGINYAFSF